MAGTALGPESDAQTPHGGADEGMTIPRDYLRMKPVSSNFALASARLRGRRPVLDGDRECSERRHQTQVRDVKDEDEDGAWADDLRGSDVDRQARIQRELHGTEEPWSVRQGEPQRQDADQKGRLGERQLRQPDAVAEHLDGPDVRKRGQEGDAHVWHRVAEIRYEAEAVAQTADGGGDAL